MADGAGRRLAPRASEELRRDEPVAFRFDGRPIDAFAGDTVGSALAAAGVDVLSRSFKYHRPRGLLCCAGRCPNCLVEVDGIPNVRACTTAVRGGMRVRSQNRFPSLRWDVLALVDRLDRLFPVGFYYKTFIRPRRLWPLYERVLRHVAGLGRIDVRRAPDLHPRKRTLHPDVVVVGGGPAGCLAALEAASAGARVVLVDDGTALGGHLRTRTRTISGDARIDGLTGVEAARRLADLVAAEAAVDVLLGATAIGLYEDGLVGVSQGETFVRLRARQIVVATGVAERPALFDDNDRPGIMLASAVLRLAHLHAVRAGDAAVVVTDDDHGWRQAAELLAAGVRVVALVDSRPGAEEPIEGSGLRAAGTAIHAGATVRAAEGRTRVRAVRAETATGETLRIGADIVALAMRPEPVIALLAQEGLAPRFDERLGEWLPGAAGETVRPAGHVTGVGDDALALAGARLAGREAAVAAGFSPDGVAAARAEHDRRVGAALAAVSEAPPLALPAGRKTFVCVCEDVTAKELVQGMAEGFDSLETLKRYSTVTMGPCQGKMCHALAARVHAATAGTSPATTGLTTSRPPYQPVSLASLAGPHLDPVRRTALHERHDAAGAVWMDMGDWKRPLHYGDVEAECRAVHEAVGLIDVSTLGKLDVAGADAGEFLDWLHPNRFSDLRIGRVRYRAMLDDAGIVVDDGTVARLSEDRFFLSTGTSSLEAVDAWLRWWLATSDRRVEVTNVTSQFAAVNLAGPRAREVLARVAEIDVTREALPYLAAGRGRIAGVPAIVLRIGFVGELGFEIHVPADYAAHLWDTLLEVGRDAGIRPFGVEAQRVLRLEKQHAIVGQDTDALSNPVDAGMGWLVKADKADWIGRDAVAAAGLRGPSQVLVGFEMVGDAVPAEGAAVVGDGRAVGRVTSAKWSPTLRRAIGLAWVPPESAVDAAEIVVRFGRGRDGATGPAIVRTDPFYDPAGERLRT